LALGELGEVPARGLRRDAGNRCEFCCGQRTAVDQRCENIRARRIANKRAEFGHIQMRSTHAA
jgi:hypothetical protein